MKMGLVSLRNLLLPVADMARARAFYEQTLGLTPRFVDGEKWVQYTIGGQNIGLAAPQETPAGVNGPVPVFGVEDISAARLMLDDAGLVYDERNMGSHGAVLTVHDPDGNTIQLFHK